jgi:hypothetical protein
MGSRNYVKSGATARVPGQYDRNATDHSAATEQRVSPLTRTELMHLTCHICSPSDVISGTSGASETSSSKFSSSRLLVLAHIAQLDIRPSAPAALSHPFSSCSCCSCCVGLSQCVHDRSGPRNGVVCARRCTAASPSTSVATRKRRRACGVALAAVRSGGARPSRTRGSLRRWCDSVPRRAAARGTVATRCSRLGSDLRTKLLTRRSGR